MDERVDPAELEGTVVVGDDGSSDAARAVVWARDDAQRRGVALVVLRAWSLTTAPRPATFEPGYVPSEDEFAAAVRDQILRGVETTLGSEPGVQVVPLPVHKSARDALVAATSYAAVVVLAARGRGLADALLGSTADHVVRQARGPVTVVPAAAG
jgi:nucleotide-binding universal stress UspA family protein